MAVLAFLLGGQGLAHAQYDDEVEGITEEATDEEVVFLDATEVDAYDGVVEPGSRIRFRADGFGPETDGELELRSQPILLLFWTADDEGVMDATAQIPYDAPVGRHAIVAVGEDPAGELREVSIDVEIGFPDSGGDGVEWLPVSGGIAGFVVAALIVTLFVRRGRPDEVRSEEQVDEGLTL